MSSPRIARLVAALVLALLAGLTLSVGPAAAHAGLVTSDPKDGATVTKAPSAVSLTFDEDMAAPAAVVVTDAAGRRVDRGSVRVSGATISVDVGVSAPGRYTVAFRVVSADGHPVSEAVSFAFVPPGATPPPATAAQPGGSSSQTALVRTVGVVGLGLLLTLVLGVALVRALRTNRQAANIAERRAAERASLHGGDPR